VKAFVFRLERLLKLRARKERERARALGDAVKDELARRAALERESEKLGQVEAQVAERGKVATAGMRVAMGLAVEAAAQRRDAAETSHRAAAEQVNEEKQRFGQARMERRVVERLRERREDAWRVDVSREEQVEHDRLATHRAHESRRK